MTYKTDYLAAMQRAHPTVEVSIIGPNKSGFHTVLLKGDKGDQRSTEKDIRDATRMLNSEGPIALRNARIDIGFKLEQLARLS